MKRKAFFATLAVSGLLSLVISGCGGSTTSNRDRTTDGIPSATESGHEHAHASEGPHGGTLIELGNEEYHAELVHDEQAGTVTVYLLDSAAKASVPIDAADVSINVKHEKQGEQFKLSASADESDPQGKSSRFVSTDAELAEELDHEHAEAQLAVTINGKPYRGTVEHHHGHDEGENGHAHE
jgi:hypothetical protein